MGFTAEVSSKIEYSAKCNFCTLVLKALGTKSLIYHLQAKQQIQINFYKQKDQSLANQSRPKVPPIVAFFKKDTKPLDEVIWKSVAVDTLNFEQISNSVLLRRAIRPDSNTLQKSQ